MKVWIPIKLVTTCPQILTKLELIIVFCRHEQTRLNPYIEGSQLMVHFCRPNNTRETYANLFADNVVLPCALLTTMILMLSQWGQLLLYTLSLLPNCINLLEVWHKHKKNQLFENYLKPCVSYLLHVRL